MNDSMIQDRWSDVMRRTTLVAVSIFIMIVVSGGCGDPEDGVDDEDIVRCPDGQALVEVEGEKICRDICDTIDDCEDGQECAEIDGEQVCTTATPVDGREPTGGDTPRADEPEPLPEVVEAVERFQDQDPDASFSYFNGHVDNFATSPKEEIPDYALPVLEQHELSTQARPPRGLPELTHADDQPRRARDLDATPEMEVPFVGEEPVDDVGDPGEGDDDEAEESDEVPETFSRSEPAERPKEFVEWERPTDELIAQQREVVAPILQGFLDQYEEVFDVGERFVAESMILSDYHVGAYGRMASFTQAYAGEEPLVYGKTVVSFDVNWNVIGVSRMLATPEKLEIPELSDQAVDPHHIPSLTRSSLERETGEHYEMWMPVNGPTLSIDPVRRKRVWDVEMVTWNGEEHYRVLLDAESGELLNITDLVSQNPRAKVNRWRFPGGDQFEPRQVVSDNIYTRGSRTLEHDFFYVMSDHRCEGNPKQSCTNTSPTSTWCAGAYGTESGSSQIRATRRTNLDFDRYYPSGASQTFYETHSYYWARWYSQWLKPALDALGKLPSNAANFDRVLIVTNACQSGSSHSRNLSMTTVGGKGQGINVIRLANRSGSSTHNAACESGHCFDNPNNIAHELNHFFLWEYFDVSSDLDCDAGVELQFTHEGALGTVTPHAFWHRFYNVGYEPDSTRKLYFSHSNIGRVHTRESNNMTVFDYKCSDYDDDPYRAGRVVGQALWEIYHGHKIEGSSGSGTWYPTTDRGFNVIIHWASELQAGSTYKDRWELANRVMEIMDKHSNLPSEGKSDWCEIFEHHELRWFINEDYCE